MSSKHATILVYRSDRTLWTDEPLRCRVIDLAGPSGPRVLSTRSVPATFELELDLPFDAGRAYGVSIDASGHRSAWHVLTRQSFTIADGQSQRDVDATVVRVMLVHRDAAPSDLASAFKGLEVQGSPFALFGAQRFDSLRSVAAKLAFLNLESKLRETRIGTRSILSLVRDIRGVAADRVFFLASAELRSLVEGSPAFDDARGHGAPAEFPGLPRHPESWKHTKFAFGNVQLSFSRDAVMSRGPGNTLMEPCVSVDCDIDLESGLGHAFEFVHNHVFNKKTDQTLVYRLLWSQGILPAYRLMPPTETTAAARMTVRVAPSAAVPRPARRARRVARAKTGRRGRRRRSTGGS